MEFGVGFGFYVGDGGFLDGVGGELFFGEEFVQVNEFLIYDVVGVDVFVVDFGVVYLVVGQVDIEVVGGDECVRVSCV